LTVSAGDSKTVQLPENQVTLKAFTMPEPADGREIEEID